ncbi:MAG: hypothetical protein H0W74_12545 [Sphingosinicella sp.]|nr:hypothetical protein [Sphingosinicella sp.]
MKINVSSIISDHLATLRDADAKRASTGDILLFYVLPALASGASMLLGFEERADAYGASITVFGIFIALLLNIQVGMFAIFQREWDISTDPRLEKIQRGTLEDRRVLLTELNANISYLILVSCTALFASLIFYTEEWERGLAPAVMVLLYTHFLLTLVMVVKRAHALFHKEYRDTKF